MLGDKKIEEYLDKVCSKVKFAKAHRGLKKEIRYHIDDQMNDYIKSGLNKDEATIKAITEMGDPIVVGEDLNKIHKPQTDWITLGLVSLLMIFGLFVLMSLKDANILKTHEIINHLKYIGIGLLMILGLYFFDYSKLEKYSYFIYGIGILMMIYSIQRTFVIGHFGHDRFTILSILSAILFIVGFAGIIERPHNPNIKELIKTMIIGGIPLVLYMMGNRKYIIAISLGLGFLFLIVNSIKRERYGENKNMNYIFLGGSVIFAGIVFLMNITTMTWHRILAFLPGYGDPRGDGWIYFIIRKQLSGAKVFGSNIVENDFNILKTLPALEYDYIFTYIIASLGWVAGLIIIGLFLFTIIRLIKMIGKLGNKFGYNIALSITLFFGVQIGMVILGNLALIPATLTYGLPFMSLGGGALLGNMILIGFLLSIWRTNNIILDRVILLPKYEIIIKRIDK